MPVGVKNGHLEGTYKMALIQEAVMEMVYYPENRKITIVRKFMMEIKFMIIDNSVGI